MSDAPPAARPVAGKFVNKAELATVLSCSHPTVDRLIRRHGDAFPVIRQGGNGKEWQFDPAAVVLYLREVEAAAAAAGQARDALVEQYRLPGVAQEAPGVTPSDLLKLAQVRRLETEEAIRASFLIETPVLRPKLEDVFSRLRRENAAAVRSTLTDNAIPEAVIRTIESRINEAWNRSIDAVQAALTNGDDPAAQARLL
jgi:phage terminase Nu1 subunit (DNA packaging protein)